MELDKFITQSLESIIKGVNEAQIFAKANGARINPELESRDSIAKAKNAVNFFNNRDGAVEVSIIDFDIAVTVTNQAGSDLNGGISVLSLKIGGGINEKDSHEMASRIKFSLPVQLPSDPESKA